MCVYTTGWQNTLMRLAQTVPEVSITHTRMSIRHHTILLYNYVVAY